MNRYYLYGSIVGDGCITVNRYRKDGSPYLGGNVVVKIGKQKECIESLLKELRPNMNVTFFDRSSGNGKGQSYGTLYWYDQSLCEELIEICGQKENKRLPRIDNYTDLMNFISGMLDTDGKVKLYSVEILNTNKSILEGLKELCEIYGVDVTLKVDSITKSGKSVYSLRFSNKTLYKMRLELQISYKDFYYKTTRDRSYSHNYIEISDDWVKENLDLIRKACSRAMVKRLLDGQGRIHKDYYQKVMNLKIDDKNRF